MYDWRKPQNGRFGFLNPQAGFESPEMTQGMQQQKIADMLRGQMGQSQGIGGGFGDLARGVVGGMAQRKANEISGNHPLYGGPTGFAATPFGQTPLGMGLGKLFGGFGK